MEVSFCERVYPMKDDFTMRRHVSLAEPKPNMIHDLVFTSYVFKSFGVSYNFMQMGSNLTKSNIQTHLTDWCHKYFLILCSHVNSKDPINDKSTLVQVTAWCRQAASHYLIQYWPRAMSPYGLTRPQWVYNPNGSSSLTVHQHEVLSASLSLMSLRWIGYTKG